MSTTEVKNWHYIGILSLLSECSKYVPESTKSKIEVVFEESKKIEPKLYYIKDNGGLELKLDK